MIQQQPDDSSCVLAAIAMAVGRPLHTIFTPEHIQQVADSEGIEDLSDWLLMAGIPRHHFAYMTIQGDETSQKEAKNLLAVLPGVLLGISSLNEAGGGHMVYWNGKRVLDPQTNRPDRKFVTSLDEVEIFEMWVLHPCAVDRKLVDLVTCADVVCNSLRSDQNPIRSGMADLLQNNVNAVCGMVGALYQDTEPEVSCQVS